MQICTPIVGLLFSGLVLAQDELTPDTLVDNGPPNNEDAGFNFAKNCPTTDEHTLLDDFEVDSGWTISELQVYYVWDCDNSCDGTGENQGTDVQIKLYEDDGNGAPDRNALVAEAMIKGYTDELTNDCFQNNKDHLLATIEFDGISLCPGKYWLECSFCNSMNGCTNRWLTSDRNANDKGSECWFYHSDGNPKLLPGSDPQHFGEPRDLAWKLRGNVPFTTYCREDSGHTNNTSKISIKNNNNSLSNGPIEVELSGGPPGQSTYLIIGNGAGIVSSPPGSNADLCVAGGSCLGRYRKDVGLIKSDTTFSTDIQNSMSGGMNYGLPSPCAGSIMACETWYFQYWHRQPMGQPSRFSEAILVTFKP